MILTTLPLILALFYEDVTARPAAPLPPAPSAVVQTEGVGSLDVSVRDQVVSGSVPRGAQRVPFVTLSLSAGCENDVTVDSITVTHRGLGDPSDIRAVYLADGSKRLTRAVRFSGANGMEANLRLKKFVIPACSATTISVMADINQTASPAGEHTITILSAEDIHTTAQKTTLSKNDAVTVETKPVKEGVLTVRMLSVPSFVSYGNNAKTARFQISSDNKADHLLRSITLTNKGTARGYDLRANYLETSSGDRVSRLTQAMDGDTITMTFDPPYLLKKNADIVFVLRSDVRGSYKTVQFALEEPSDLYATLWKKP